MPKPFVTLLLSTLPPLELQHLRNLEDPESEGPLREALCGLLKSLSLHDTSRDSVVNFEASLLMLLDLGYSRVQLYSGLGNTEVFLAMGWLMSKFNVLESSRPSIAPLPTVSTFGDFIPPPPPAYTSASPDVESLHHRVSLLSRSLCSYPPVSSEKISLAMLSQPGMLETLVGQTKLYEALEKRKKDEAAIWSYFATTLQSCDSAPSFSNSPVSEAWRALELEAFRRRDLCSWLKSHAPPHLTYTAISFGSAARPRQRFRPSPEPQIKRRDQAYPDEFSEESEQKMREVLSRAMGAVRDVSPFEIITKEQD